MKNKYWKVILMPMDNDAQPANYQNDVVYRGLTYEEATDFMRRWIDDFEKKQKKTLDLITPEGRMSSWIL